MATTLTHQKVKIGHKKTANYGIAVNQVCFPLGNDVVKVKIILTRGANQFPKNK